MTAFDVVAILMVAVSALIGFARGAVREVVTLVAFGAAAVIALLALPFTAPVMRAVVHKPAWAGAASAVVVVFVLVYVLLRVFGGQLARFLHASNLGGPDRALGAGVGVARALVALGGFFLLYDKAMPRDLSPGWITGGATWPVARASGHALEKLAPQGGRLSDGVGRLMRDNVKSGFGVPDADTEDDGGGVQLGGSDGSDAVGEAAPTPRRIPRKADSDDNRRGLQVRLTDDRRPRRPHARATGDEESPR